MHVAKETNLIWLLITNDKANRQNHGENKNSDSQGLWKPVGVGGREGINNQNSQGSKTILYDTWDANISH